MTLDLRGLNPAPVTPFTADGDIDFDAIQRLGAWLGSIDGVKSLTVLGHAGEGTFLTVDEQLAVIGAFRRLHRRQHPDHRRHHRRGKQGRRPRGEARRRRRRLGRPRLPLARLAALRLPGRRPADALPGDLQTSGLPLILFQYPDNTKATYNLDTQLEIAGQEGVFATKNGVRNMRRWYTEIPALRAAYPDLQILSCHDEYLLPTMFDVDGLLVGYGNIAPEPLVELIAAGKAQDYPAARAIHERLLPVTKNVYHRGSHMEGTVALKWGLVHRGILDHATVRPPLLPLADGADAEIAAAFASAGLDKVTVSGLIRSGRRPRDRGRPPRHPPLPRRHTSQRRHRGTAALQRRRTTMSEHTTTRHTSTTPGTGYGRISTETMRTIVETRKKRRTFWQQLGLIGPAFVAGAWQFGPGNLTTAVQAGSGYPVRPDLGDRRLDDPDDLPHRHERAPRHQVPGLAHLVDQGSPRHGGRRHRRHRHLPHHAVLLRRQRRRIGARPVDAVRRQPRSCGP